uniref:Reverse transcriptase domain-containing protein n=1 Tax=Sipha flava TaxID=143950 RepID=A0A2S2R187_9HEMI
MSSLPLLIQPIEESIKEIKVNTNGISINGQKIHSIRFADDIALMAESTVDLKLMLHCLDTTLTKFSLKINRKKTKVLVLSKSDQQNATIIIISNESIEQVKKCCYLGSLITEDNRSTKEIKRRIASAIQAYEKKRFLLTYENLSIQTRKCFIKSYI